MSDVVTSILVDETVRDDQAVEELLQKEAEAASPWFNAPAE
jgi:hypothetical protein